MEMNPPLTGKGTRAVELLQRLNEKHDTIGKVVDVIGTQRQSSPWLPTRCVPWPCIPSTGNTFIGQTPPATRRSSTQDNHPASA